MDFLFVADDDFEIDARRRGRVVAATERVARGARRGDRARRDVRVDASTRSTSGPSIEALGIKPRKVMPALYAAIEGAHRGLPLFDSICLLGRERTLGAAAAPRTPRPDSASDAGETGPLVWSSPFGGGVIGNTTGSGPVFGGSSPPPRARRHHADSPAPSSSGLGRRPLKAVTAVRICSGLHREPGRPPRMAGLRPRARASTTRRRRVADASHERDAHACMRDLSHVAMTRVRALDVDPRDMHAISTTSRANCRTLATSCVARVQSAMCSVVDASLSEYASERGTFVGHVCACRRVCTRRRNA